MTKFLVLFFGLLNIHNSFATVHDFAGVSRPRSPQISCMGGVQFARYNLSRPLEAVSNLQSPTWINESEFDGKTFNFKVELVNNHYNYRVFWKEENSLLINEDVLQIPKLITVPLNEDEQLFLYCEPENASNYCRFHNC